MYTTFFSCLGGGQAEVRSINRLYIMIGQSNMDGRGEVADLPAYLQDPLFGAYIWIPGAGWSTLHAGVNGSSTKQVGPIFEFAYQMLIKYPGDRHGFIFLAEGGSELYPVVSQSNWYPDTIGSLYDQTIALFLEVEETLSNYTKMGICWHQGEADARNLTYANSYLANEEYLIQQIKADTGFPLFITGKLHDSLPQPDYQYYTTVNTAKDNNTQDDGVFNTNTFSLKPDSVHFDTAGAIQLGQAFATYL